MSVREDSTFCHYCGRKATPDLELQWDHVPSLYIKIPREYIKLIKKTLIRACAECKKMSLDQPHIEYLDRHIWLKNEYLQTYESLLLTGQHISPITEKNDFINEYNGNPLVSYEEILSLIGFGLADLSQISSPILNLKDNNGNYLSDVLNKYLSLPIIQNESDELDNPLLNIDRFFAILSIDFAEQPERLNKKNYDNMYQRYGYRVDNIIMPRDPDIAYSLTWDNMIQIIEYIEDYKQQEKDYYIDDLIELLDQDQDYYCTYKEFIEELANVMENRIKNPISKKMYDFHVEQDFESWYENHKSLLNQLGIPALPCHIYQKKWTDICIDLDELLAVPRI